MNMILDLFRKEIEFNNIGYGDIKDIPRRASDAEDNYNLLFIGPPASAKINKIIIFFYVVHLAVQRHFFC
jgi:hypothetical protein